MIRVRGTKPLLALAVCGILSIGSAPLWAEMIDINLTGFRVQYSNITNKLYDTVDDDGGNLLPSEAIKLTGTVFSINNNAVAEYSSMGGQSTYADILVENISPDLMVPSPISSATGNNGGAFGFDWFYDDGGTMRNLRLNFADVTVALISTGNAVKPTLIVTGTTNDWSQSNLPEGLMFDEGSDISFSYTTSNTMLFDISDEEFVDLLASGGVMQISGEGQRIVPEPSTALLGFSSLFILMIMTHHANSISRSRRVALEHVDKRR